MVGRKVVRPDSRLRTVRGAILGAARPPSTIGVAEPQRSGEPMPLWDLRLMPLGHDVHAHSDQAVRVPAVGLPGSCPTCGEQSAAAHRACSPGKGSRAHPPSEYAHLVTARKLSPRRAG